MGSAEHLTRGARGRRLRLAAVVAVAATSAGTLLAAAVFTRTTSSTGNTFSAGTVDLTAAPATAAITMSGMVPGDTVTAPITVTNTGTLQLRYALKSTTTEDTLAAQLDLTVKTGVTTCTTAGFGVDGTTVYGPADLGSSTGLNILGNPAQGAQAGDRTLNAGANEVLCLQVSLPLSSSDTYQGRTTTATLDFIAEQTAHNP
jgi:spore coat-associated protein N